MRSTPRTSVRRLASGSYIVSGVRRRSAVTGQFIAPATEPEARSTTAPSDATARSVGRSAATGRYVTGTVARRNPGKTVVEGTNTTEATSSSSR